MSTSASTFITTATITTTASANAALSNSINTNASSANGANTQNLQSNLDSNNNNANQTHLLPIVPCSFPPMNAIRKRKVKFTVVLNIEELLSVPYLNGVLFCKVRLCDGGNHVSYSSKKDVSNSSVIWSNDLPIQFDVKTVQLYTTSPPIQSSTTTTSTASTSTTSSNTPPAQAVTASLTSNAQIQSIPFILNHKNQSNQYYVIGYEPCLCRISVRKELRGGKSYQKLGYVDYNLSDYIFKYQQELYACLLNSSSLNPQFIKTNSAEYGVNRILKEYEHHSSGLSASSSKKNQQRLDNSYLKIKIKVIDPSINLAMLNSSSNYSPVSNSKIPLSLSLNQVSSNGSEYNLNSSSPTNPKRSQPSSPMNKLSSVKLFNNNGTSGAGKQTNQTNDINSSDPNVKDDTKPGALNQQLTINPGPSPSPTTQIALISINDKQVNSDSFTPTHSRNSSSSTALSQSLNSSSIFNSTNNPAMTSTTSANSINKSSNSGLLPINNSQNGNSAHPHGHNRSCSNGSIKSNVSFDFIIKNRNKKLIEDIQSTSSSNSGLLLTQHQQQQQQPQTNVLINSNLNNPVQLSTTSLLNSNSTNQNPTTNSSKLEPANQRIIETRFDANEIISQIENELTNRINKQH